MRASPRTTDVAPPASTVVVSLASRRHAEASDGTFLALEALAGGDGMAPRSVRSAAARRAPLRHDDPHGLRPARQRASASIVPINASRRARAARRRGAGLTGRLRSAVAVLTTALARRSPATSPS